MKHRVFILLMLAYHTITFSQEFLKFDIRNGSSTVSDFSIVFEERDFKGNVKFNQLKITLRDIDFSLNDKYDNEHLKFLLGVVSAYAIGVSIDIQERSDYFTIEIGKLSYSLNDWDIDISQPDKFNQMVMSAKVDIQNLKVLPPRSFRENLNSEQIENFRYFSENNGEIIIKKVLIDFSLDNDRNFRIKGTLDLPIGKTNISAIMSLGRDFNDKPFFETLQLDFTSLSPVGKLFIENLTRSTELPFEKKGIGYTLQIAGYLNDSVKSSNELFELSKENLKNNQTDQAIRDLRSLLDNYPNDSLASQAQYKLASIYLNWKNDLVAGYSALQQTVEKYSQSIQGKQAQTEIDEFPEYIINIAESLRKRKMVKEAVDHLMYMTEKYSQHNLTSKAQYMLGDIYMNDLRDFNTAIQEYRKVIEQFSGSEQEPDALFMVGYIYGNILKDTKSAKIEYQKFLEMFPNHKLSPSVKYEIEYLGNC